MRTFYYNSQSGVVCEDDENGGNHQVSFDEAKAYVQSGGAWDGNCSFGHLVRFDFDQAAIAEMYNPKG